MPDAAGDGDVGGSQTFIVLKFGGTSVSSAANWKRIAAIIRQRLGARDETSPKIVIVHSALSKVTDKLHLCLHQAIERRRSSGDGGADGGSSNFKDASQPAGTHRVTLEEIIAQHMSLAADMGIPTDEAELLLLPYRKELQRILEGASLIAEVSPRTTARVVAMGELLSTTLGAAFLETALSDIGGCMWLEARELLRSSDAASGLLSPPDELSFLNASCDCPPRKSLQRQMAQASQRIFLTQGFIAAKANGDTVLLGRGGSDTSASYIACLLQAQRLEIWTDVPGMFTANPRIEANARLLRTLSFEEAQVRF